MKDAGIFFLATEFRCSEIGQKSKIDLQKWAFTDSRIEKHTIIMLGAALQYVFNSVLITELHSKDNEAARRK